VLDDAWDDAIDEDDEPVADLPTNTWFNTEDVEALDEIDEIDEIELISMDLPPRCEIYLLRSVHRRVC